jgi:hypothetical protein
MVVDNLRYYPGIFQAGLRKSKTKLSQDGRSPGRDLRLGPPEYEAGGLTTRPRRLGSLDTDGTIILI